MGELNTSEEKINQVSGVAGQVKTSQGPGLPSVWATPSGLTSKLLSHTRVLSAANGAVAYAGYGFQPKALIVHAADASGVYSYFSWGLADENLAEMCLSNASFAWGECIPRGCWSCGKIRRP